MGAQLIGSQDISESQDIVIYQAYRPSLYKGTDDLVTRVATRETNWPK